MLAAYVFICTFDDVVFNVIVLYDREEALQMQKRKKRKIKGNSRLSFSEDIESESEEENGESMELFHF